jgi:hypothetical protein
MTTQLHNIGEEFERKVLSGEIALPSSVDVLLFHDGEVTGDTTNGDDLAAADDIAAISTEPDGASFTRQSVSLDGATSWTLQQDANSDYQMQISATLTFDLSDSSNPDDIDAYAVVVNWDAGSGAADHLWWTDTLDQGYDVQSVDSFDFDDGALAVSGQNAP